MSITLDNKAVDVFKLYDELSVAYVKEIDGFKFLLKAIEAMIAQKEEMFEALKNQAIDLIKTSLSSPAVPPSEDTHACQPVKKFNYAGVDENDLVPEPGIVSENIISSLSDAVIDKEIPPKQVLLPKSERPYLKNTSLPGKGKTKQSEKAEKQRIHSKSTDDESRNDQPPKSPKKQIVKVESTGDASKIKCLYHPEVAAVDHGRQLCTSCKWKLINSGLMNFHEEPEVVAYLKGEIPKFPNLGQSMCPIHPEVPSYNRKTALCKVCQKKANEIGIRDRLLNKEEINLLRNPSM